MHSNAAADARVRARSRILAVGVPTLVLNRGLAAAIPLLVVPIGLNHLGTAGYGAWAAALSITAFVAFADLGIGTGLMTRLGQLQLSDAQDANRARQYVASAYAMMVGIVSIALALLFCSAPLVDWAALLGVHHGPDRSRIESIVLATIAAFIVNMLGSLIVRVQYGVGQQGRSNLWQALASISALAATWAGARLDFAPGWFVLCAAFAPVGVSLINTVSFFKVSRIGRGLAPKLGDVRQAVMRSLMSLGGRFLAVSVLMTASVAVDPWIVARTSALTEVPSYAIPFRIFTLIGAISVMLALPLWPLHAQAIVAGDVQWIRRITARMTLGSSALVAITSLAAVVVGPNLVEAWLGHGLSRSILLWGGLALWWFVQTVTGAAFMVQNGAEVLGPQTVGYLCLLVALPLKWWVSATYGFEWIPLVGSVLYVLIIWPACFVGYRRALEGATLNMPEEQEQV